MNAIRSRKSSVQVEPLEQRIAPAVLTDFAPVTVGTPILLDADSSTPSIPAGITAGLNGTPLLFVEKGSCLVFTTDFNGNGAVDFNEITGIAAGDGLRLISFVDIHGDIVTNLRPDGTLTDSDGLAANGRDGQVLLNSKIESIQLRSIRQDELPLNTDLEDKIALSSYSIFGNIYAGGGFGVSNGGLLIDTTGAPVQEQHFNGSGSETAVWVQTKPQFGSIRVGSAASGRFFNFGASLADDSVGQLQPFTPPSNIPGADIINIRAANPAIQFNFGTLQAGNGGFNGRGGDIVNVIVGGDTSGGYGLIAGDAGAGPTGQRGGNIENWVDFGSITSEIVIKTGNGGQGLVGRGGDAGSVTFGDILALDTDNDPTTPPVVPKSAANIAGRLKLTLGDGGSGLTGGGAGGSFPTAKFTAPEPLLAFPLEVVSTWHRPGDIGQTISVDAAGLPLAPADPLYHAIRGIDWDGDGANDIVYTSTQNNGIQGGQLVVVFGNPNFVPVPTPTTPPENLNSLDPTRTLFLDAPDNPDALTVGDFNGDGKPDIAVASGSANAGGIQIVFSQYDPVSGAFVGFSDAFYSSLPALGGVIPTFPIDRFYARSPHAVQVFELASGDFDGDGAVDLGVMGERGFYLLHGDLDLGPNGSTPIATGRLFSDTVSNFGLVPVDITNNLNGAAVRGEFPVVKATALADGGRDIVVAAVQGTRTISAFTFTGGALGFIGVGLGSVDTNREVSDVGKTDKISLTPATVRDFTFFDFNRDGRAEISILTASPEGFLINKSERDALPTTIFDLVVSDRFDDGVAGGNDADENRGIRIGGRTGPSNFGLGLSDSGLVGIMTQTSLVGGVHVNSVMVVDYETDAGGVAPIVGNVMRFAPNTPPGAGESPNYLIVSRGALQQFPAPPAYTPDLSLRPFDTYLPFASTAAPTIASMILGLPTKDAPFPFVPDVESLYGFHFLDRNGFFIKAGDGGASANGPGGRGGTVGNSLRFDAATGQAVGTFDIVLPAFPQFFATVRILGGDGGDGFRDAGAGGTLAGISVRYPVGSGTLTDAALLFSGDGGNSIKGKGGKGGDLRSLFIAGGDLFVAGSGGNGVIGGAGGSVIGNDLGLEDTTGAIDRGDIDNVTGIDVAVFAGQGGSGVRLGGGGGDINGFTPFFVPVLANIGGFYHLRSGDGGNATIGAGGRGGSIIDSSPRSENNSLDGSIFALAGRGGNGTKGGDGGNIRNFINESTGERTALSTTFLAGDAGIGTSGPGGTGGSLINVRTDGTGEGFQVYFDLTDRENFELIGDAIVTVLTLPFSRMVAGEGGTSLGGSGGKGGDILHVFGTASNSTFAMAAGRGGDGLLRGGAGGSVMDAVSNSGSSNSVTKSQVLIIAGEGGDAFSGIIRTSDPLVPGRRLPAAGAGGSIVDFQQLGATDVNVQLIAGNGGNTPNAGSTTDIKTKVGRGGSIQNVSVAGRIGDTGDPTDGTNAPIKPYNPLTDIDPSNDRMSDFVRTSLVGDPETVPAGFVALPLVNGDTGNVGIVVGAKGRVRDGNNDGKLDPAPDVVGSVPNGSLINVRAAHIMSAVADHVERIASIQVLRDVIVTTTGGEYGSDRNVDTTGATASPTDGVPYTLGPIPGSLDYLRPDGTHSPTPVIGGRLVDGAIVAKTSRVPLSDRDFKIG
jgi:hypothetical protein